MTYIIIGLLIWVLVSVVWFLRIVISIVTFSTPSSNRWYDYILGAPMLLILLVVNLFKRKKSQ